MALPCRCFVNEHPRKRAEVSAFFLDPTEVSNAEYKEFVLQTARPEPAEWIQNADNPRPQARDRPRGQSALDCTR
jgi:formylglycine-generating enzyme required for sulfatase activity